MEVNKTYDTGVLLEDGSWSTVARWVNYHVWTDEEKAFWDVQVNKYGLADKMYTNNGDGTYSMTCSCDSNTVIPDLINTMVEKGLYQFPSFSWKWNNQNGVGTVTVSLTDSY